MIYSFKYIVLESVCPNFSLSRHDPKLVCDDFAGYKASFEQGITVVHDGKPLPSLPHIAMTVEVLRPHPVTVTADPGDEADAILDLAPPEPEASNWRSLLIVAAGVLLFVALLQPLGWLIAGSLLFAVVGFGLGARSPLGLVLGGVGMTSAIQIVFSGFLGIHVPAGILG